MGMNILRIEIEAVYAIAIVALLHWIVYIWAEMSRILLK